MPEFSYSVTCYSELDDCKPGTKVQDRLLIESIGTGDLKQFKQALAAGADVNVKAKYDYSPLMFAVMRRKRNMVKLLLDAGADVNAQNCDGMTVLFFAKNSSKTMLRLLLESGADPDIKDRFGHTAGICTAEKGNR